MAKAWYLYNSGSIFASSSYTIFNPIDFNAAPPCPDGCILCAIKSTTGAPGKPINPLSNNVFLYLTNFMIAQRLQPILTDPYVVGKGSC
ncbi:hypothetical protein HDE70_002859 [Pedobacter cryoconitis]|nr:hypothetical protein [Pedobacter cryoconitis]